MNEYIFGFLALGCFTFVLGLENKLVSNSFNGSNILVLGGYPDSNKATVFNKEYNCQGLSDLPLNLYRSVGAFIDQQPVLCSGYSEGPRDECYKFKDAQWEQFASIQTARFYAAGVALDSGKLWITGGFDGGSFLKSTEYVKLDGEVTQGFDLLEGLYGHCMIKSNEDEQRVFIIGGLNAYGSFTGKTRIYVVTLDNTYYIEDGPSLNTPRDLHGCSTFTSANHNDREIAVAVGGYNGRKLNSVEVWDYQTPGSKWMTIDHLPVTMDFNPGVLASPYNDGAVIVYESIVLHLKSGNGSYWYEKYPVLPDFPRNRAVTMWIPESLTDC